MELLRRYANRSDLLVDLSSAVARLHGKSVAPETDEPDELDSTGDHPRQHLLSARFTDDDVASMIAKYEAGTAAKIIAKEYKIGLSSLKRLIREHGARRKDQDQDA